MLLAALFTFVFMHPLSVSCLDGPKFQMVYVYSGDNLHDEVSAFLKVLVGRTNSYFGGARVLRVVDDSDCSEAILPVRMASTDDYLTVVHDLKEQARLFDWDRKYIVFIDASLPGVCGNTGMFIDDRPEQANLNNSATSYSLIWRNCWTEAAVVHEIGHALGAVQSSAPHATPGRHCWELVDVMCYADGTAQSQLVMRCSGFTGFDCGQDDYYNPNPAPGSYLATHWNIANSRFLEVTEPKKWTVYVP